MAPGCISGGSICRCPCQGDPNWNKPSKLALQLRRQLKSILEFEKKSKKSNLKVNSPKNKKLLDIL